MSDTLVIQSCPAAETNGWLAACMQSVCDWTERQGFVYRWLDDALFGFLPEPLQPAGLITPVIASDLARLLWARELLLQAEVSQVLWLDADVLIFAPERLALPDADYAVGREVWVQRDDDKGLRSYRKVHNAALFFRGDAQGRNSFLDFYAETAARFLLENQQGMPAQFIGPKLLTAMHNVVQLPVMESVGMISPLLAEDLLGARNGALECYARKAMVPLAAANLCRSGVAGGEMDVQSMLQLIDVLEGGSQSAPL